MMASSQYFLDLFGRYAFGLDFPITMDMQRRQERVFLLKVGVLEPWWLVQSFGKDGKEIPGMRNFGEQPLEMSVRFFAKYLPR